MQEMLLLLYNNIIINYYVTVIIFARNKASLLICTEASLSQGYDFNLLATTDTTYAKHDFCGIIARVVLLYYLPLPYFSSIRIYNTEVAMFVISSESQLLH